MASDGDSDTSDGEMFTLDLTAAAVTKVVVQAGDDLAPSVGRLQHAKENLLAAWGKVLQRRDGISKAVGDALLTVAARLGTAILTVGEAIARTIDILFGATRGAMRGLVGGAAPNTTPWYVGIVTAICVGVAAALRLSLAVGWNVAAVLGIVTKHVFGALARFAGPAVRKAWKVIRVLGTVLWHLVRGTRPSPAAPAAPPLRDLPMDIHQVATDLNVLLEKKDLHAALERFTRAQVTTFATAQALGAGRDGNEVCTMGLQHNVQTSIETLMRIHGKLPLQRHVARILRMVAAHILQCGAIESARTLAVDHSASAVRSHGHYASNFGTAVDQWVTLDFSEPLESILRRKEMTPPSSTHAWRWIYEIFHRLLKQKVFASPAQDAVQQPIPATPAQASSPPQERRADSGDSERKQGEEVRASVRSMPPARLFSPASRPASTTMRGHNPSHDETPEQRLEAANRAIDALIAQGIDRDEFPDKVEAIAQRFGIEDYRSFEHNAMVSFWNQFRKYIQ